MSTNEEVMAVAVAPKTDLIPSRQQRFLNRLSIACAGSALVCDGYHNSLMTAINLIFKQRYPKEYTSYYTTAMSNAMTVGQILGMLFFGLVCDFFSRKKAISLTTGFMVLGALLAAVAHGHTTQGMFWMLIVMRGVTGFGVGGEFPTSSAITLEAAAENERMSNKKLRRRRGWLFILIVNVPLQLGGPISMSCFLVVWEICGGVKHLSAMWRTMFGIGAVLPIFVYVMRMKLTTSQLFRSGKFIDYNMPWVLAFKFYYKRLFGTCFSFLLYDMIVTPNGLFSSLIIKSLVSHGNIKRTAEWQLLLGALTLPGVFVGALMCEKIGRKRTMMIGFAGFLVFGVVIGAAFDKMKKIVPLFVVFYGLFQAVGHMGPGTMMGLITTESYATGVRATFYGLSLAFGRVGGVIGTEVFSPIQKDLGQKWTFYISAIIGAAAIVFVWLFMPDLDSRDMMYEDARFAAYLRSQNYHGKIGFAEAGADSVPEEGKDQTKVQTFAQSDEESLSEGEGLPVYGVEREDRVEKPKRTLKQRIFSMHPFDI